MTRHYLDHASTSPPRPEVVRAVVDWYELHEGADPGRVHYEGRWARARLEEARTAVAELVGAAPRQVVFTSGGTEAVNAAVWGAHRRRPGGAMVLADVEHSSVRDASARVAPVERLEVDRWGRIDPDAVGQAIERVGPSEVALVHCQLANHEVGTIQPVAEVAEACRRQEVLVHVDACAAVGHRAVSFDDLGADLVSFSAHKFGGPPGVGALVIRRGLRLDPMLLGGEQERARRAGFESLPAALGMAAAATALLGSGQVDEAAASKTHIDRIEAAVAGVDGVEVVGDRAGCLPNLITMVVHGVEAEAVLLGLDQRGIAAHSGSSCSSESLAPSPVLQAMGVDADHSLRLSVGWSTCDDDIDAFLQAFPEVVGGLRSLRT